MDFILDTGIFFYPLLLCSIVSTYVSIERLMSLRTKSMLPENLFKAVLENNLSDLDYLSNTLAGRVLEFIRQEEKIKDKDVIKAFINLEINTLQKGIYLLEITASIAPLIGLLGTVIGLTSVFSNFSLEGSLIDTGSFSAGIALALNTTILGLIVAIPSYIMYLYFTRKIEVISSKLELILESVYQNKIT